MSFELSDPPVVTPAGKYVVIVDQYGYTRVLARPTNRALLAFDGDDFYWVDGTDALPVVLNNIKVANETSSLNGVMAMNAGGRVYRLVNESNVKMVVKSQGGILFLEDETNPNSSGIVPLLGKGVLGQNVNDIPFWHDDNGVVYINSSGQATSVENGTAGQVLRMVSGVPSFADLPGGSVAAGSGSIGLEGVMAERIGVGLVNIQVSTFSLTNGTLPMTVTGVDEDVNFANPNGLLGLDAGSEAANTWYYIYIISNGTLVSAIISDDPVSPDFGATGYTYWGLASVFRNDAAGDIVYFLQRGRQFSTPAIVMTQNGTITMTWGAIPQTTAMGNIVPPNVKTVSGTLGGSDSSSVNVVMSIGSTIGGVGWQAISSVGFADEFNSFENGAGNFRNVIVADPAVPALYWKGNANDTKRRLVLTGYTI